MPRDQRPDGDAVRITTAATSRREDIAARQRRYVWSMAVRTVCFVAAIAVGPGWLRWVLVAAAVLLPYVAVVMANASSTRSDGFALPDGRARPELTSRAGPVASPRTPPGDQPREQPHATPDSPP